MKKVVGTYPPIFLAEIKVRSFYEMYYIVFIRIDFLAKFYFFSIWLKLHDSWAKAVQGGIIAVK